MSAHLFKPDDYVVLTCEGKAERGMTGVVNAVRPYTGPRMYADWEYQLRDIRWDGLPRAPIWIRETWLAKTSPDWTNVAEAFSWIGWWVTMASTLIPPHASFDGIVVSRDHILALATLIEPIEFIVIEGVVSINKDATEE